jgi:hypothetical protein
MLDRAPPIADAVEPLCHSDVMRIISIAAVCAARRAIDREKHAHAIKQIGQDYPSVPVLTRDPRAELDVSYSRRMVNVAVGFVEVLARISAAAETLRRGEIFRSAATTRSPAPSTSSARWRCGGTRSRSRSRRHAVLSRNATARGLLDSCLKALHSNSTG